MLTLSTMEDTREQMQRMIEALFRERKSVSRLDIVIRAEAVDLPDEAIGIVNLLPPGRYTRQKLCDQLNSAIVGHGWSRRFGTFD